ncbi:MAG: hypothetical protein P8182_11345 [Deltaproteobacteria bacterium]
MKSGSKRCEHLQSSTRPGGPGCRLIFILAFSACLLALQAHHALGSAYNFIRMTTPGTLFAVDPDLTIRTINPHAPDRLWTLGESWGLPPLFLHTRVGNAFQRVDFFYPFGSREESRFQSKLRFTPFFKSRWSKIPPFDGYSRCLTLFEGRSDLGQWYWGFFPFYGYTYRRYGVDSNFFFLFPLYYESTDDDARTIRLLWPLITYADSPGRSSLKVWPLFGKDAVRGDYFNWFVAWPFFQKIDKYPGTPQAYSYLALPFPLYIRQDTPVSCSTDILWPFITYYHHYPSGHHRYSFRPFLTYGTGGGIEELSIFFVYSQKKDLRKGTETGTGSGYVSVGDDEVFTERKFLLVSTIQKRYRKGMLVFSRYRFWPFAEYTWDLNRGSHLKIPEVINLKNDWWDLNLGRLLRFVDFRDTPITRELSLLFGLSGQTDIKKFPHIAPPPKPGKDNWAELISGAFGKR